MAKFKDDIRVTEKNPRVFEGTVTNNWSVNGNPNGGYLMAIVAGAMMKHSDRKSTPIITANYLTRCAPGKAEVVVEEISQSTQFNRYEARLIQEGKEKIRALGTFMLDKKACEVERYESSAPELAPVESCIAIPEMPQYTLFENLDMRIDPASAAWLQGETTDKSEQKGWVKFKAGGSYDILSLFLIADSIPPAIFVSQGPVAWVPTIELSTNIRNMPQTEWLKFVLRTRFVTCGLLEADGEVWDEAGNLVSISRQIAQVRMS